MLVESDRRETSVVKKPWFYKTNEFLRSATCLELLVVWSTSTDIPRLFVQGAFRSGSSIARL
jgi:hypothetical protein